MLITSKFQSTCKACNGVVKPGDRVSWVKGVQGVTHAACSPEGQAVQAAQAVSHATDANIEIPVPSGLALLPYQRAGVAAVSHFIGNGAKGALIADEMGLGKTIQAIGYINSNPRITTVLVVCPASLKVNWTREWYKWSTRSFHIDVVNYEQCKKLPTFQAWDLLVIDEAHFIKNPKAKRTQEVKRLASQCREIIALSGTPIVNRPVELFPLLSLLDPRTWDPAGRAKVGKVYKQVGQGEGAGYFRYALRYCAAHAEHHARWKACTGRGCKYCHWTFAGASNLEELQEKLRTSVMVRRLKADVLTELPPKRRQVVYLPFTGEDDYADIELSDDFDDALTNVRKKVPFDKLSRTRHEQGLAKVPQVVDFVREQLGDAAENTHKLVLFAHHKDVIAQLASELAEYGVMTLTGDTSMPDRQHAVDVFQQDPNCRIFIGSIQAAGVGLTLTAASHVILAELDWTPGNVQQAEDRCHRIGQRESVLVQHLVFEGTLDARLVELLDSKQAVITKAVDKRTIVAPPDGLEHASWCAKSLVGSPCDCLPAPRPRDYVAPAPIPRFITDAEVSRIHTALKMLAGVCDGAQAPDGAGFNKLDSSFGKSLAMSAKLTDKQALAARKMLRKYRRQIGEV